MHARGIEEAKDGSETKRLYAEEEEEEQTPCRSTAPIVRYVGGGTLGDWESGVDDESTALVRRTCDKCRVSLSLRC